MRIPAYCSHDPETVVLAHLGGAGMGRKHPDLLGAWCCAACHDVVDGRVASEYSNLEVRLMHLDGIMRTQLKLIDAGLVEDK